MVWPIGGVSAWGVVALAADLSITAALISVTCLLIRASKVAGQFVIGIVLSLAIGNLAAFGYFLIIEQDYSWKHWGVAIAAGYLPTLAFAAAILGGRRMFAVLRAAVVVLPLGASTAATAIGIIPYDYVFETAIDDVELERPEYQRTDVEALYYAQPAKMQKQLSRLFPQDPGLIDVYGLALAGTAYQGVFLREVEAVSSILYQNYHALGRVIVLANSNAAPMRYPMANSPNLRASLARMASVMDPAQDIAVLYLTSHGSEDVFALSFYEAGTNNLTAAEFARMLDETGLKNVVIVISACHAGSFIDDLQAPDRMIVAAAATDKRSFGCSDQNDWTWWGRAYFDQALRTDPDFRTAFDTARTLVSEWEEEAGHTPSEPQVFIGDEISGRLDALSDQLTRIAKVERDLMIRP